MISVVIPCKNPISIYGEEIVLESLKSIINQTFPDIEIILSSYGNDKDAAYLSLLLKDSRIKIIKSRETFTQALNDGIKFSHFDLIARHDLDDISEKSRLEIQKKYLETNPEIALLGTMAYELKENEKGEFDKIKFHRPLPIFKTEDIIKQTRITNPFIHGSVIFRKSLLEPIGYYSEKYDIVQDFEFWCRIMGSGFKVSNLKHYLYCWRNWNRSTTISRWSESQKIRKETYKKWESKLKRILICE